MSAPSNVILINIEKKVWLELGSFVEFFHYNPTNREGEILTSALRTTDKIVTFAYEDIQESITKKNGSLYLFCEIVGYDHYIRALFEEEELEIMPSCKDEGVIYATPTSGYRSGKDRKFIL